MTAEKIAVFTTSEIFEQVQEGQRRPRYILDSQLKTTVDDSDCTKWNIYSRGSLEHALKQGYTVYVVSTRSRLGNHDFWWIEMVGLENIFWPARRILSERLLSAGISSMKNLVLSGRILMGALLGGQRRVQCCKITV